MPMLRLSGVRSGGRSRARVEQKIRERARALPGRFLERAQQLGLAHVEHVFVIRAHPAHARALRAGAPRARAVRIVGRAHERHVVPDAKRNAAVSNNPNELVLKRRAVVRLHARANARRTHTQSARAIGCACAQCGAPRASARALRAWLLGRWRRRGRGERVQAEAKRRSGEQRAASVTSRTSVTAAAGGERTRRRRATQLVAAIVRLERKRAIVLEREREEPRRRPREARGASSLGQAAARLTSVLVAAAQALGRKVRA